jgi:peptidoglycan/xylan/chitin deacetylase (PgdA/CDA1 family)
MAYLASYAHVCSLEESVERIKVDDITDNAIVVTFDDGYQDNFLNAFPILKEYSIPATFFLATGVIGSGCSLWHDRVFSAFRETRTTELRNFGTQRQGYSLRTIQDRLVAQCQILKFLKSLNEEERLFWIGRLREELCVGDTEEAPDLMLTWDQVKIMHASGMAFGSHTVTHPILSRLSPVQVREEVCVSKRMIEENLGVSINTFAYPNGRPGDFDRVTKNILQESGYTCAVSTIFGANALDQDLFELRRGGPTESHLPTFATKLHWYRLCAGM